jgi:hypothetical protein
MRSENTDPREVVAEALKSSAELTLIKKKEKQSTTVVMRPRHDGTMWKGLTPNAMNRALEINRISVKKLNEIIKSSAQVRISC